VAEAGLDWLTEGIEACLQGSMDEVTQPHHLLQVDLTKNAKRSLEAAIRQA